MAAQRKGGAAGASAQSPAEAAIGAADAEAIAFAAFIERLPESQRLGPLLALFERLSPAGALPTAPPAASDVQMHFWLAAMAQHRLGEPERLATMLRQGSPPPPMVADYLASIAEQHAPRPRGRPKQGMSRSATLHETLSELVERRAAWRRFRARYDELRREPSVARAPGGTPGEHALAALASECSISIAEARRRLREGKRWADPPPRSNAAERDQIEPKWVRISCAHCYRATSISVAMLESLLKIP